MKLDYEYSLAIRLAATQSAIRHAADQLLRAALCRQAQQLRRELGVA